MIPDGLCVNDLPSDENYNAEFSSVSDSNSYYYDNPLYDRAITPLCACQPDTNYSILEKLGSSNSNSNIESSLNIEHLTHNTTESISTVLDRLNKLIKECQRIFTDNQKTAAELWRKSNKETNDSDVITIQKLVPALQKIVSLSLSTITDHEEEMLNNTTVRLKSFCNQILSRRFLYGSYYRRFKKQCAYFPNKVGNSSVSWSTFKTNQETLTDGTKVYHSNSSSGETVETFSSPTKGNSIIYQKRTETVWTNSKANIGTNSKTVAGTNFTDRITDIFGDIFKVTHRDEFEETFEARFRDQMKTDLEEDDLLDVSFWNFPQN